MNDTEEMEHLPKLGGDCRLTPEQIESFRKNGHTMVRGLASSSEIDVYEPIISEKVKEHAKQTLPLGQRDTFGKAFIQIGNLWQQSAAVQRFVYARRFAKVAADLLGVDGVRIFIDQALFKEPGGGHTPWHQDHVYWPFDTDDSLTMWMPLVDVPAEMGTLTFASGSHKEGYVSKEVISDESHRTLGQFIEKKGFETVTYGAMAAGDATFHNGWTLHSAPGNPTDRMREVMNVIYFSDGAKLLEPDNNARRTSMKRFPGCEPGGLAASPLNPLLYHRSWDNS